ncbi:Serine proteinase stubble [Orchesella cincta]|uniref:Serine proteinase stubble n=1 Tax=Orchesella cincta TaxID=48709 RepID=A0A1D2NAL6_ORCCI|nr:Serine proteinase stubble [Orchesella cincta]
MELPEMMEDKLVDVSWFFRNKFEYFYKSIVVAILPSKKTLKKDISAQQILEVEQYDFNLFHAFQKLAFGKMDLDICTLKLKNPLNFNDPTTKILPLCLPTQYLDKELIGFEAHSSGWKVYNEMDATATPSVNNVVFEYFTMSSIKISPRAHCRTNVFPLLVSESFTCSRAAPLSEVYGINSGGSPVMISSKSSPSQFVMIGIHAWSSYMVFDAKPPTSLETNVSGGTVINDKTILTAAHCVRRIDKKSIIRELVPPGNFSVKIRRYAGTQYYDNNSVEVEVEYVVPHPLFKGPLSTGANYDVALLILKKRLDFNEHRMWVSPICLPETGETVGEAGREDALTLGFGRNDVFTGGKFPTVLQQLQIRILSKIKCSENWDKAIEAARIAFPKQKYSDAVLDLTNRVCAGTENNITNYKDALPGDSGGPLMVALMRNDTSTVKPGSETNPFIQVGVTSIVNFPILKALHNKSDPPTVVIYMSVQDMLPFIDYYSLAVEARWCARG